MNTNTTIDRLLQKQRFFKIGFFSETIKCFRKRKHNFNVNPLILLIESVGHQKLNEKEPS